MIGIVSVIMIYYLFSVLAEGLLVVLFSFIISSAHASCWPILDEDKKFQSRCVSKTSDNDDKDETIIFCDEANVNANLRHRNLKKRIKMPLPGIILPLGDSGEKNEKES